MKELVILLPVKPLSVNSKFTLHRRSRFLIKSKKATDYEKLLNSHLSEYLDLLKELGKAFKKGKHAIRFDLEIMVPKHEFFTKDGAIHQKCLDVTNAIKILEDSVFKLVGVDDSQITQANVSKSPWHRETWCCIVTIKIINAPKASYLADPLSFLSSPQSI